MARTPTASELTSEATIEKLERELEQRKKKEEEWKCVAKQLKERLIVKLKASSTSENFN